MTQDPHADEGAAFVEELSPHAGGLWLVRSASATRYFLDLDRRLLLRAPGSGSPTGAYDHCWVHLVGIETPTPDPGDPAQGWVPVRVGRRHIYHLDPKPGDPRTPYRWWLQREVTSIRAVPDTSWPVGRTPAPDEEDTPYRHPGPRPSLGDGTQDSGEVG